MSLDEFTTPELLAEIARRRQSGEIMTAAEVCRKYGIAKQQISDLAARMRFIKLDSNRYIEASQAEDFINGGGLKFRRKVK